MSNQSWRVLAIFCHQKAESTRASGTVDELINHPVGHTEVLVLRNRTLQEVGEQILVWQPNVVYFSGENGRQPSVGKLPTLTWRAQEGESSTGGPDELAMIFQGIAVDTVYFDAPGCSRQADLLRTMGVSNAIFWAAASVQAGHAAHFSRAFFAGLRDPSSSALEAFAVAMQTTQTHCTTTTPGNHQIAPVMPQLLSGSAPSLPDMDSIPPPTVSGAHIITGSMAGIPGWDSIRLLAPHAELRLLICGPSSLIDTKRLGAFGLALRALLVREMRNLKLVSLEPCTKVPAHLPPGSLASRCTFRTASGASTEVVLGGPKEVLERQDAVQLALRHTLTADSLSLQMRLPPSKAPLPQPKSANHVAFGCAVVDVIAITSVWAVNVLRCLCQDPTQRGLVTLGVAAVGGSPVASFNLTDAAHFAAFAPDIGKPPTGKKASQAAGALTQPAYQGPSPMWEPPSREGSYERSGSGAWMDDDEDWGPKKKRKRQKSRLAPDDEMDYDDGGDYQRVDIPYISNRPSLRNCTEEQFMEDYCSFCSSQMGRRVTPDTWPDTVLNGIRLDVYNLYKEVAQRGGFGMGNGINWKGQIFPRMRNYTPTHKMTGIGNALKTKYQQLLLEYERVHPEDVTSDRCAICGGGEEVATDWVSCDRCDTWVHFSCDERPGLGAFKEYAKSDGLSYICADCAT